MGVIAGTNSSRFAVGSHRPARRDFAHAAYGAGKLGFFFNLGLSERDLRKEGVHGALCGGNRRRGHAEGSRDQAGI